MSRQISGVDLDGIVNERLELCPSEREAVKRGNNTSGSVDPDDEFA